VSSPGTRAANEVPRESYTAARQCCMCWVDACVGVTPDLKFAHTPVGVRRPEGTHRGRDTSVGEMVGERRGGDTVRETVGETVIDTVGEDITVGDSVRDTQ
jgi:hypothetical protein